MSTHTPGPWSISRHGPSHYGANQGDLPITFGRDGVVADVMFNESRGAAERDANARLIAAAPVMAEELVITKRLLREVAANILVEGDTCTQLNERARRINEVLMGALLEDAPDNGVSVRGS